MLVGVVTVWERLTPVFVVLGIFAFVGFVILPGRKRKRRPTGDVHYVEVCAFETRDEAVAFAHYLRECGVDGVANCEERPDDMGTLFRADVSDERPFVVVPQAQRNAGDELLAAWNDDAEDDDLEDGFDEDVALPIAPGDEFDPANDTAHERFKRKVQRASVVVVFAVFAAIVLYSLLFD